MLRELYKHWLMKDTLLRVDTIKHERNGVGTPIIEAMPGASRPQMQALGQLASAFKAGETAGGAIPAGTKLRLMGTEGSLPDTIASIKYHDERMAASWLMMFMQLGTTQTGSRALGAEMIDYFALAQESIALWFAGIFSDHLIEDWCDWNYGEDEPAPSLEFHRNEDNNLAVTDLVALVQCGAVSLDDSLKQELRERYDLPDINPDDPTPLQPAPTPPTTTAGHPKVAQPKARTTQANNPLPMPERNLRRLPNEHEIRAAMDLAKYDDHFQKAVDAVMTEWPAIKAEQVGALKAKIAKTKDPVKLSKVQAPALGHELLQQHMGTAIVNGIKQAEAEAKAQGVKPAKVTATKLEERAATHAEAVANLLADSISQSAGAKAIRLAEGNTKAQTAKLTAEYLDSLKDTFVRDLVGGAIQMATNVGRFEVFAQTTPNNPATFYASEILDGGTCDACAAIDGEPYQTLDDGTADYPTGGYSDCEGGARCRGTLIAIYEDEAEPSVE
jgi:hypothetical protein